MTNLDGYDWGSLGFHGNQLPGDPGVVADTATAFRSTADHLSLASRSLRRLDSSSDTCSEAVEKIVRKANDVADVLDRVYARYADASGALSAYAPVLAMAQQQAEQALRGATQARHDHDVASSNAAQARAHALTTVDPAQRQEFLQHYYAQRARAESASSSLDHARAVILQAMSDRDDAANRAAGQINDVIDQNGLNDGLRDHLGEVLHDLKDLAAYVYEHDPLLKALVDSVKATAKWVWDNIDTIALVLTVVAFAISWVPGVGQIALGLALLARAASALSTAKSLLVMAQTGLRSYKTHDWGPFIQAGGSFLVSYGVGKVARGITNQVSKRAVAGLIDESLGQTGTLRTAENAMLRGGLAPGYHPGHNPLARMTAEGRVADRLVSTFKGSDYTTRASDLGHVVHIAESDAAHQVLTDVVLKPLSQAGDAVVQAGANSAHDHSPSGYRSITQGPRTGGSGW